MSDFSFRKPKFKKRSVKTNPRVFKVPRFKPFEERVLRVATHSLRPLTTRQISRYAGMSYNATKNNLINLNRKGIIRRKKLSNRTYWSR